MFIITRIIIQIIMLIMIICYSYAYCDTMPTTMIICLFFTPTIMRSIMLYEDDNIRMITHIIMEMIIPIMIICLRR